MGGPLSRQVAHVTAGNVARPGRPARPTENGNVQLAFRPAGEDDAPAVLALVRRAYRGEASRAGWTTEADLLDDGRIELPELLHKITGPESLVLVVESRGDLVACCELAHRGDGLAYFGLFAVEPTLQAGGLGRRVLAEAERVARGLWSSTVMEMTVIGQRSELIFWYERRGYALTGERRPFPYDELGSGGALRDDLYFAVLRKPLV
jgi:GNAT superfamily N-acetyltransferase